MQIAILLASYNGEKFISEQIESLLSQTFGDFTLYIHDDGSSDDTPRIISDYAKKYPEKIKLLDYPAQGGAKANFLSMLERVEADYYFFCDQDDKWVPQKLYKFLETVDFKPRAEKPILIYSDLFIADENMAIKADSFLDFCGIDISALGWKDIFCKGYIPGCAMMINSALRNASLHFASSKAIVMHDWWFISVLYALGGQAEKLDEATVYYRQHSSNEIGVRKENIFTRLATNLSFLFSGHYLAEKRKFFYPQRDMAHQLSFIPDALPDRIAFAEEFSKIGSKNKLSRIKFYRENFTNTKFKFNYLWI